MSVIQDCVLKCQAYRTTGMRLRLMRKNWDKASGSRIARLEAYYDAIQKLQPGQVLSEIEPQLARDGIAVETECTEFHSNVNAIRKMHFEQLKVALAAVGTSFGMSMSADKRGSLGKRFRFYWRQANVYRKQHVDGIELHGLHFDENGPMFTAFANAMGVKARAFADDLRLESNMRSGRCNADLGAAIRLGILA